jgi:transposase
VGADRAVVAVERGSAGHPFGDDRKVVEGIVYRYRTGIPWRDLPRDVFGPWQTVSKRHRRYAGDGTWDRVLGRLLAEADAAGKVGWRVSVDATITRAHQHATNTTRPEQDTGAVSNYKNQPLAECEPAGHGIGRSRGGLSTKIHAGVDGHGRPLALVVTGGQRNDGAALETVLADIRIPGLHGGRARTRPEAVIADRAYSAAAYRAAQARNHGRDPSKERPDRGPQETRAQRRATSGAGRRSLQGKQRCRTLLRPGQAVEGPGHPIRQARHHLPRRRRPVRVHHRDPHIGEPTTSTSFPRT